MPKSVDPATVAWNPPELLSREADAYIPDGEYRALKSVEVVGATDDHPGREAYTWGDRVVLVTVWDGADRETRSLVSESFEPYTGSAADYKPRREDVQS